MCIRDRGETAAEEDGTEAGESSPEEAAAAEPETEKYQPVDETVVVKADPVSYTHLDVYKRQDSGKAVELSLASMEANKKKETELRDHLIHRVMTEIPYVRLNGHPSQRLSNNANFSFQFIEGESLLIMLDMAGICGSSGSACTSRCV